MLESKESRRIASVICVCLLFLGIGTVYVNVQETCDGPPSECGNCICDSVPEEKCAGLDRTACLTKGIKTEYCNWDTPENPNECVVRKDAPSYPTFSGTMHDEDRHKRTIMLIYPCFLGIALWDVLVLRTPRFREGKNDKAPVPGGLGYCAAVLAVVSLPCAFISLWTDPEGWTHTLLLQLWVFLRFLNFLPIIYVYMATARTTFQRVATGVMFVWTLAVFATACYIIYTMYFTEAGQSGAVQVMTIYFFLTLAVFVTIVLFAETFEPESTSKHEELDTSPAATA
jgi:hypothetical protein